MSTANRISPDALIQLVHTRAAMRETLELSPANISALYDYFTQMTPDERAVWAGECIYSPGEVIFLEGSIGDHALLIWSGEVAVIKGDLDTPTILAYRGPGALVGDMALIDDQPRSATLVALEAVQALCIEREQFGALIREVPELGLDIMMMLSARLRGAHQQQIAQMMLARQLAAQLEQAGREQLSLLPHDPPQIPGWDFAVNLTPVWQTSGDFFDFVQLPEGRLGLVVADVADKGSRAAMYMALACTLLRTYAPNHPDDPARVLAAANTRLLADTDSDSFVTLFYGVLDPVTGALTYASAGHNPAILSTGPNTVPVELPRSGPPLGVMRAVDWEQHTITIPAGARLVLYTDGVNEAANTADQQFGTHRIRALAQSLPGERAESLRVALMAAVRTFVGAADQGDDMTLMVVVREG